MDTIKTYHAVQTEESMEWLVPNQGTRTRVKPKGSECIKTPAYADMFRRQTRLIGQAQLRRNMNICEK